MILGTLLLGLITGIFGGFFGIGGAIIAIPLLVYFFKFPQHLAQGTMLAAMVPPIGILAALRYYQAGNVDIKVAALIAFGFVVGGLIGASFAHQVSPTILKKCFALLLVGMAIKLWVNK